MWEQNLKMEDCWQRPLGPTIVPDLVATTFQFNLSWWKANQRFFSGQLPIQLDKDRKNILGRKGAKTSTFSNTHSTYQTGTRLDINNSLKIYSQIETNPYFQSTPQSINMETLRGHKCDKRGTDSRWKSIWRKKERKLLCIMIRMKINSEVLLWYSVQGTYSLLKWLY